MFCRILFHYSGQSVISCGNIHKTKIAATQVIVCSVKVLSELTCSGNFGLVLNRDLSGGSSSGNIDTFHTIQLSRGAEFEIEHVEVSESAVQVLTLCLTLSPGLGAGPGAGRGGGEEQGGAQAAQLGDQGRHRGPGRPGVPAHVRSEGLKLIQFLKEIFLKHINTLLISLIFAVHRQEDKIILFALNVCSMYNKQS